MPDAPSFAGTIARLAPDGDAFVFETDEAWAQGRTLFGGMTAALAYAGAVRALGELPPLRSAQLSFVGPAAGRLRFMPALLRRGRSSVVAAVDCLGEQGLAARATFLFAAPRDSVIAHDRVPRPTVPPPDACTPLHRTARPLPGFLGRFEFRHAGGSRLFEPEGEPDYAAWIRMRDGEGDDADTALLALADAAPCAAMAVFPKPAAVSTMTWGIDIHRPPAPDPDGWRLLHTASESAGDGYSAQAMRLYDRTGQPLASARQLVALFV